jgi:hypothetical protein
LRNLRLALGASLNPLFQTQPNQTVQEITNYSPNLRIREREITERGLPGPGSDRMKCARRSPASARRRRRNPARSTPSTPTRHPLERRDHIGVSKLPCSSTRGGNRADSRTHIPVDGWCPERRRTARKEPPFWSMWRAGRCPLPLPSPPPLPLRLRCLPTRRDQRGIPIWLAWACGFQNSGGREIPRPDHGGEGGWAARAPRAWRSSPISRRVGVRLIGSFCFGASRLALAADADRGGGLSA